MRVNFEYGMIQLYKYLKICQISKLIESEHLSTHLYYI